VYYNIVFSLFKEEINKKRKYIDKLCDKIKEKLLGSIKWKIFY